jgi:lysophospholipase L1-like esterase
MLKHIILRVVLLAAVALLACLAVSSARADSQNPWISNGLSLQRQAETKSIPASLNGNIDCAKEDAFNCSVSTTYGVATQNSSIRLNGTSDFLPTYSNIDNHQHFLPIPNSNSFITYTAEPVYGFYLYFNYNLSSHLSMRNNGLGAYYQVISPPDGVLSDKANHKLAADYNSMSFSQNGQWMVVSDPNAAMLRVNLETFEALPFATGFNYSLGLDPNIKTAITNDGRYAVVESREFNRFTIYDLDTCGDVPDTITGPVNCQSRDLSGFMSQQIAGYSFTSYLRFLDDDTLSAYSTSTIGPINQTFRYIISPDKISDQLQYLALGDSYISGEGAFNYIGGTDQPDNKCHLSSLAYPFLIGRGLNYDSYHSVACSGAVTEDIIDTSDHYKGQADNKQIEWVKRKPESTNSIFSSFKPGYATQIAFIKRYEPQAVTISVSGNDVGMIGKLKSCIAPGTCFSTYEERLGFVQDVNKVFPKLVDTYTKIRNAGPPDMRIYAIGYPQIAKSGGDCALNVHLDSDEVIFTTQAIDYLDGVIKAAAAKAGIYYADTEDALYGHRFCEAGPGSVAMNGITAGNDLPKRFDGPIGSESYHPNPFGYQLMEDKILEVTDNLTAPMPEPNPNARIPSPDSSGILNAPKSGVPAGQSEYDQNLSEDLAYVSSPMDVSITGAEHSLGANSPLRAELHSTRISLGDYKTDANGNLTARVTIPPDIPAGYHSLHIYGADISGQAIDIYKEIYIGYSADDLDGNGTKDSLQKCIGVVESNQDTDRDGIDDSCDGDISMPPAGPTQPAAITTTISSQTPELIVFSSTPSQSTSMTNMALTARAQSQPAKVLGASATSPSPPAGPGQKDIRLQPKYFSYSLGLILIASLVFSIIF